MRPWLPALVAILLSSVATASEPKVVASIVPVHSLVAGVMEGVGTPVLLAEGTGSPHGQSLGASAVQALAEADRVFWIGPGLETFLRRATPGLAEHASVPLAERATLRLRALRPHGPWDGHDHDHAGIHANGATDFHIWLDPTNAAKVVDVIIVELIAIDPGNAVRYRENGAVLRAKLDALDAELAAQLAPVRTIPFVVFHDAYLYFEARYDLNAVGSITLGPANASGAKRLFEIRAKIIQTGVACVFSEPQFSARLVGTVVEDTDARAAALDPIGAALTPGPEAYFSLMRNLAADLVACLTKRD